MGYLIYLVHCHKLGFQERFPTCCWHVDSNLETFWEWRASETQWEVVLQDGLSRRKGMLSLTNSTWLAFGAYICCGIFALCALVVYLLLTGCEFMRFKKQQKESSPSSSIPSKAHCSQVIYSFFGSIDKKKEAIKKMSTQPVISKLRSDLANGYVDIFYGRTSKAIPSPFYFPTTGWIRRSFCSGFICQGMATLHSDLQSLFPLYGNINMAMLYWMPKNGTFYSVGSVE